MQTENSSVGPAVAGDENGQFLMADVEFIGPSPWNREQFDPEEQKKLEESVRERGVLQAIRLRPNPKYREEVDCKFWNVVTQTEGTVAVAGIESAEEAEGVCARLNAPLFEIIMGERRWRASVAVGRAQIPSMVRVTPDRQAIEEQKVENLQREGLNAIDEATGYQQLVDLYKREGAGAKEAVKMVAERVGVSVSIVYDRIKLLSLPEEIKAATLSRVLPPSQASSIAKVRDPEVQMRIFGLVMGAGEEERDVDSAVLSARDTELLVAKALEKQKEDDAYQKLKAEYEKAGRTVLTAKESKEVLPYGDHYAIGDYVRADAACHYDKDNRSYREVLKDQSALLVLARARGDGAAVELFPEGEARQWLIKLGVIVERTGDDEEPESEEQRARREERDRANALQDYREQAFKTHLGKCVEAAEAADSPAVWRIAFIGMVQGDNYYTGEMLERRGIEIPEEHEDQPEEWMPERFTKATGKELRGLAVELALWNWSPAYRDTEWNPFLVEASKALGVKMPPWEPKAKKAKAVQTSGASDEEGQI